MKTQNDRITTIVNNHHTSIKHRLIALKEAGFTVVNRSMGSGGVLQEKSGMGGKAYIQVSHGKGKYNYAYAVVIQK